MTSRYARALAYVALWSPIALGFALALALEEHLQWSLAVVAGVSIALPAAILGLGVIALARKVRDAAMSVGTAVLAHALGCAGYSLLWTASIVTELAMFQGHAVVQGFLRAGFAWQLVMGTIVYVVIAGIENMLAARLAERERHSRLEQSESLRLRAELSALRSRLDPHFLFNVLQTLGALIDDRPADAHRALDLLGELLQRRLGISDDDDLTTLAVELVDARQYMALEALRFGERFRTREALAPETLQCLVPRFTLQPLIENALRHGIAPKASGGLLDLSSRARDDGSWELRISDDGVGASSECVAGRAGIGLDTVRERIRLHFGDAARVEAETAPNEGFAVTVVFPLDPDESRQ